jgi:hypothetical protein
MAALSLDHLRPYNKRNMKHKKTSTRLHRPPNNPQRHRKANDSRRTTNTCNLTIPLHLARRLFSFPGRACQWISFLLILRRRLRDADGAASIDEKRNGSRIDLWAADGGAANLRAADVARSIEEKQGENGNAGCSVVKEELRLGQSGYPLSLKVTPS